MSSDSPDSNRKLTSSFSSPEFDQQAAASSARTTTIENNTNGMNVSITSSNSSQTIKTFTATGIKLNSTRDSGFSDSIIEDCSQSSTSSSIIRAFGYPQPGQAAAAATEHVFNVRNLEQQCPDITMSTKCYANKGRLSNSFWIEFYFA